MKVVDFFCGGGGFSEGFRQAGFDIVFAVDKWEPAIITYKGNKPGVNVVLDDVIRISNLPDDQFEALVPDSEVIIGSPPCQSFSHSNKSGNADKSIGIKLIKAYLKIIARKKYKKNSILKYWVLENVPSVKEYIEDEYTAEDLGLEGSFVLRPHGGNSGKYNAKYYGAPTNRQRYLCGEFPPLQRTNEDNNVKTLGDVLKTLGENLQLAIKEFICQKCRNLPSYNDFQVRYCMTTTERKEANVMGPYELLDEVKAFIVRTIPEQQFENRICLNEVPHSLPLAIAVGYIILNQITHEMGGK